MLKKISNSLYNYYKKRGNFEKALIYHEEFKMLSDTTLYSNHNKVIKGMEDSHKLKISEQENQRLKQEGIISSFTIQRQRLIVLSSLFFISGLSLLLFYLFKGSKKRQQLNDQLKASNAKLELNNIEVKTNAKESLESKNKELATKIMQISKRSSELEEIRENLQDLYRSANSTTKLKISKIINKVNQAVDIEDGWHTFSIYFNEIHPSFIKGLKSETNELSNNEIRHCTFIKLGLSNKEVSEMLNVSSKSVEVAKYRIKKKLLLGKDQSLTDYLANI